MVVCNKNLKACRNSITYKYVPIFRTDKPYFIRVWEKCFGTVTNSSTVVSSYKRQPVTKPFVLGIQRQGCLDLEHRLHWIK